MLGHKPIVIALIAYPGAVGMSFCCTKEKQLLCLVSYRLLKGSPLAWGLALLRTGTGASLVVQWLRICLPMQRTRVWALVWEDPTCRGATGPVSHNYWACASGACAPQRERPRQWEARAPRWRVAPAHHTWRKPSHRNEDPTQPKINK